MQLRHLLPLFLTGALAISAVAVWLPVELRQALDRVVVAQDRRFESIQLADELRQSSDDLTRFARSFVQTGEERFQEYFRLVLAIRNGDVPRPEGYERAYWDRVIVANQVPQMGSGEAISLQERMIRLEFVQVEFALLAEAQRRSDDLTVIEDRAFSAMRGFFDDGTGAYVLAGPPDPTLAQNLLYRDDYLRAKASIMEPIGQFQKQVSSRTAETLAAVQNDTKSLLLGTFVASGGLLGLLLVFSVIVHRRVLVRIGSLADVARQITAGELGVRSGIRGKDEFGVLASAFDHMVSRLAETLTLVTAAKARMEEELDVAREIQMSMLPVAFPAFPDHDEFEIYATLRPALEVGGDFYDFYFISEDEVCVCIGDASDKGVPAALFMAVTKALVKSKASDQRDPQRILSTLNDELSADNPSCMFVSLVVGLLNIRTGTFRFTNAGHNPPFVLRSDGAIESLTELHGPVVGATSGHAYGDSQVGLDPGDAIFMYSDGVTEAMDTANHLYGEKRLARALDGVKSLSPEKLVDGVVSSVDEFVAGAKPSDDVTVLALKFDGPAIEQAAS